jgi:large subunit ribosomal protein L6
MSRIGRKPVDVLAGVTVTTSGREVQVEGPQGKLTLNLRPEVDVEIDADGKSVTVSVNRKGREARAFHGLTRSLINNMIIGVKNGYEKRLEVVGVGYVAAIQNNQLQLRVGFANEIHKPIPAELDVSCPDQTHVVVKGPDKQKVGQFAAEVRAVRKPEPYKGKGIRYQGEHVKIKPGKAAT